MPAPRSQLTASLGPRPNSSILLARSSDPLLMRVEMTAGTSTGPAQWPGRLSGKTWMFQYDRILRKQVLRVPADIWCADNGYVAQDIMSNPDPRWPMMVYPEPRTAPMAESERFVPSPHLPRPEPVEQTPVDPQPDPEATPPVDPVPEPAPEPDPAPEPTPDPEPIQSASEDAIQAETPKKRGRKPKPTE